MESAPKPLVFVSHPHEHAAVAMELKRLLVAHLGESAVDFFISSDGDSVRVGDLWFSGVRAHLERCAVQIVLYSVDAASRHWIHFEAGVGWAREKTVIPLFYAGVALADLPDYLRERQASDGTKDAEVASMVRSVAKAVGCELVKSIECSGFTAFVKAFSAKHIAGSAFFRYYDESRNIHADLGTFIRVAAESIILTGIHFNISLGNRLPDYLAALERGVSLTFCTVKPSKKSAALRSLETFSGTDTLGDECQQTPMWYDQLRRAHKRMKDRGATPGRLSLRWATSPPAARAYLFDHTTSIGKILFTPYLHLRDSTACPSLLFPAGHSLFQAFAESSLQQVDAASIHYDSDNAPA